jgi:hypothetical protein
MITVRKQFAHLEVRKETTYEKKNYGVPCKEV